MINLKASFGYRNLVAEKMMTGLAEWLSLLQVCVETNVEHKKCRFPACFNFISIL
jgi:hypothetical protein